MLAFQRARHGNKGYGARLEETELWSEGYTEVDEGPKILLEERLAFQFSKWVKA